MKKQEPARCRKCDAPLAIAAPAPEGCDLCGACEARSGCVRFGDGKLYRPVPTRTPWVPKFRRVGR